MPADAPRADAGPLRPAAGWPLVVLCLAIVAAPWPYGCVRDAARYTLVSAQLLAVVLWLWQLRRAGLGLPGLALPLLGLPALALLQLAFGLSAAPVWTAEALLLLGAGAGTLLYCREQAADSRAGQRLALVIVAACAAQAMFGAVQWSQSPTQLYGQKAVYISSPFGSYVNHNHFAGFVEVGVLLAAGLAIAEMRRREAVALGWASASLGMAAVVLASRSRGGLLALLGGTVVLVLLAPLLGERRVRPASFARRAAWTAGLGLVLLVFGLAVVPQATRRHLATVLQGPSDLSGRYRLETYAATLRLALAHPLAGSGLGAFPDAYPAFKRNHGDVRTTHAESDALEFLSEAGLLGLLALGVIGRALWRGLSDRLRNGRDPARKGVALGAAAAAGALLTHSLVDFNLRLPSTALLFVCVLGLASAPRTPEARLRDSRVPGIVALVLLALGLWRALATVALDDALRASGAGARITALSPVLARAPFLAEGFRIRGQSWAELAHGDAPMAPARLERAAADFEWALRLRPAWGEVWASLGVVNARQGASKAAQAAFERAVGLDPTHWGVSVARVEFLGRTSPPAAIDELVRLRSLNPKFTLGSAQALAGRFTQDPSLLARLRAAWN